MNRRIFCISAGAIFSGSLLPSVALAQQTRLTPTNALLEFQKLKITKNQLANSTSPGIIKNLEGALMLAPMGMVNWYFANLGLYFSLKSFSDTQIYDTVIPHLNSYLRNIEPSGIIRDIEFPTWDWTTGQPTSWQYAARDRDSDDSYAATFAALSSSVYLRLKQSTTYQQFIQTWWNNNSPTIKAIVQKNLLAMIKINSLTTTFRSDLSIPSHILNSSYYTDFASQRAACDVGYFMDNCEVYRGLADFTQALKLNNDNNYLIAQAGANRIATGLASLYKTKQKAYLHADCETNLSTDFYPGASAQTFATIFDITPEIQSGRAINAMQYFKLYATNWEYWSSNLGLDSYPWACLAYAAIKSQKMRTDKALLKKAKTLLANIERNFVVLRPSVTINELGFYLASKQLLG